MPDFATDIAAPTGPAARRRRVGVLPAARVARRAMSQTEWLVVADEQAEVDALRVAAGRGAVVRQVKVRDVAGEIAAATGPVAVVVAGDDASTAATVLRRAAVPTVIADPAPTVERAAEAAQKGAADYVPSALADADDLPGRLRRVAARAWAEDRMDRRLDRLQSAVRRLNVARRAVSRKVDVLCHDFVDGYGEVARQVEEVRQASHLRSLLADAVDLEQLLCHTMDWLLRHVGHCNIAIFLDDDDGRAELGAYMKHTIPGDAPIVHWLSTTALPAIDKLPAGGGGGASVYRAEPEELLPTIDVLDSTLSQLVDHVVMAGRCTYLAEPLATIVLLRRDDEPLGDEQAALLRLACEAFAAALTSTIRQDAADFGADDAVGVDDDADDADDWWKRGDASPF